jgi:hypothetical protein
VSAADDVDEADTAVVSCSLFGCFIAWSPDDRNRCRVADTLKPSVVQSGSENQS